MQSTLFTEKNQTLRGLTSQESPKPANIFWINNLQSLVRGETFRQLATFLGKVDTRAFANFSTSHTVSVMMKWSVQEDDPKYTHTHNTQLHGFRWWIWIHQFCHIGWTGWDHHIEFIMTVVVMMQMKPILWAILERLWYTHLRKTCLAAVCKDLCRLLGAKSDTEWQEPTGIHGPD